MSYCTDCAKYLNRIAELEADRDSWRRVCERLEAENARLVQQLSGIAKDIERYDSQNLLLTEQVERLSAPVTDAEWISRPRGGCETYTRDQLDALIAARKEAGQ